MFTTQSEHTKPIQQSRMTVHPNVAYIKFCLGFYKSFPVTHIDKEHNTVNCREVVFPYTTGWKQTRQHTIEVSEKKKYKLSVFIIMA